MKPSVSGKMAVLAGVLLAGVSVSFAQDPPPGAQTSAPATSSMAPPYKPKFHGDPAHSDAEAGALGYIRTVLTAQKLYKKKHDSFATSLPGLVHTGSFTQRMTKTDRGEYYVGFRSEGKGSGFSLSLTPKQYDDAHRAFYADDSGNIRVDDSKEATENSQRLR